MDSTLALSNVAIAHNWKVQHRNLLGCSNAVQDGELSVMREGIVGRKREKHFVGCGWKEKLSITSKDRVAYEKEVFPRWKKEKKAYIMARLFGRVIVRSWKVSV